MLDVCIDGVLHNVDDDQTLASTRPSKMGGRRVPRGIRFRDTYKERVNERAG